jgi:hypothetical protein
MSKKKGPEDFKIPFDKLKDSDKILNFNKLDLGYISKMNSDFKMGEALRSFGDTQNRFREFSKGLVDMGIIRHTKTVDIFLKSGIYKSYIPMISHLKIIDSMVSFREMAALKPQLSFLSTFPSVGLYRDILDSLDEEALEKLEYLAVDEEEIIDQIGKIEEEPIEDIQIVNPSFFATAVHINIHINMTDSKINESGTEDEKNIWNKYAKGACFSYKPCLCLGLVQMYR